MEYSSSGSEADYVHLQTLVSDESSAPVLQHSRGAAVVETDWTVEAIADEIVSKLPLSNAADVVPSAGNNTSGITAVAPPRGTSAASAASAAVAAGEPRISHVPTSSSEDFLERRPDGSLICMLCKTGVMFKGPLLTSHLRGRRHLAHVAALEAEAALADLARMNGWLLRFGYEVAPSKTQARLALRRIHVNLFDLLAERDGPVFSTVFGLRAYTLAEKVVFPKTAAKEGGALRVFLRHLF